MEVGTPHLGSKLAEIATNIPMLKHTFKLINDLQPVSDNIFLLKNRNINICLIIRDDNESITGKMISNKSDGRVEVCSALSADANDAIILPYGHTKIHHKGETLNLIRYFLSNGYFKDKKD
jgi:hypothetical protein